MSEWRYLLQSVPDKEFIDLDVPLTNVTLTDAINAPGDISGTLPIEYSALQKSNGELAIREYGTMLHVERDGEIISSGIIDTIGIQNETLSISAGGFSVYPSDQPYLGKKKTYISTDPAQVIRDCWAYLLSFPDSLPDVSIDTITTDIRVGKPEGRNLTNAKTKLTAEKKKLEQLEKDVQTSNAQVAAAKKAVFTAAKRKSVGEIIEQSTTPSGKKASKNNLFRDTDDSKIFYHSGTTWVEVTTNTAAINTAITNYRLKKTAYDAAVQKVKNQKTVIKTIEDQIRDLSEEEAEPLVLSWDTTDDLQTVIGDMVEQSGIEFRERSSWSGDDIHYRLQMGNPIGTRRTNIYFEIGPNVSVVPSVKFTEYASGVLVLGAGEGEKRVRKEKHSDTGGLRKVVVQAAPQATSTAKADSEAKRFLKEAQAQRTIDQITVINHSLAPFGTFSPGDEIRVTGDAGWADLDTWVRIKKITYSPDIDTADLEVTVV